MKQFKNILYVTEPSIEQFSTFTRAITLAESSQADLTVIDVVPVVKMSGDMPYGGPVSFDLQSAIVDERRLKLESLVAPYRQRLKIEVDVRVGQTFLEAIRAVLKNGHDLLIKPAENPSFITRLFGSNDMHLLRKCPCPVWMMKPDEKQRYERILAAVDFDLDATDTAEQGLNPQILEISSLLALADSAELHFVHVWDAPAEIMIKLWSDRPESAGMMYVQGERLRHERAFDRLRYGLSEQVGREAFDHLAPQFHLHRGEAPKTIPEIAQQLQADLVVMGTVARTGIAGLIIGNTAEAILEQLQCSVLAVKPIGFVSPIKLTE